MSDSSDIYEKYRLATSTLLKFDTAMSEIGELLLTWRNQSEKMSVVAMERPLTSDENEWMKKVRLRTEGMAIAIDIIKKHVVGEG